MIVVFRQEEEGIFFEPRWLNTMKQDRLKHLFDLSEFAADHRLSGPVAINWAPAVTDAFSIKNARQAKLADNCILLTKNRLQELNPRFLKVDALDTIDSYLNIKYYPDSAQFRVCCQDYNYP